MDLFVVPLLQTARVVTRYCLPERVDDLPHITLQIAEFLDTFSSNTTIVRAYKRTGSLRCVQHVASRELPETQDPFYKRWLLNRTAELAASNGDLPTLQWLMEVYLPVEPVDIVVDYAAAFGHLDVLQWLYDRHFDRVHFGRSEMCGALENKHEDVVNWLREYAEPAAKYRGKVFCSAAKGGDMSVVEWLCTAYSAVVDASQALQAAIDGCNWEIARYIIERYNLFGCELDVYFPTKYGNLSFLNYLSSRKFKPCHSTIHVAAAHGHLDTVKWLFSDEIMIGEAVAEAAQHGHLDVVQWLLEMRGDKCLSGEPSRAFVRAAEYGRLDVIQWIHARWYCNCGTDAMDCAAAGGHLDVVKWLHENRKGHCSEKAMDRAAANGHLDVVKYLHEHYTKGCTTLAMDDAAGAGHLDMVKWLNDHRSEGCSTKAMDSAAQNGHLDVIQWLHANRKEGCTTKAMDDAAQNGHLNIVKWLHENRSEGCTTAGMDEAAKFGHLRIVKWLHEHRTEGCTIRAMNKAAVNGHLGVVKWLHMNRSEGCTKIAVLGSISNRHFDVALFLHTHLAWRINLAPASSMRIPLEMQQWMHVNYADDARRWRIGVYPIQLEDRAKQERRLHVPNDSPQKGYPCWIRSRTLVC